LETVRRLTPTVRDRRAGYEQSLAVLARVKTIQPERITKTSLMLGLGETRDELLETFEDIRTAGVDVLTLGQYLQPSKKHLKVVDYIAPEVFDALAEHARKLGFLYVAAGPLVRSSYKAGEYFLSNHLARERADQLRSVMEV
jgi:lipoic acid synthetase